MQVLVQKIIDGQPITMKDLQFTNHQQLAKLYKKACKKKDLPQVKILDHIIPYPDIRDSYLWTPIERSHNIDIAIWLIDKYPSIQIKHNTSMMYQLYIRHSKYSSNIDMDKLFKYSCEEGFLETAKLIYLTNPMYYTNSKRNKIFTEACINGK